MIEEETTAMRHGKSDAVRALFHYVSLRRLTGRADYMHDPILDFPV